MESVFTIGVDNLTRIVERILRGRHQRGNTSFAQRFSYLCNSAHDALIAIRFPSIAVMQKLRPVERSGYDNPVLLAQVENFIRRINAVRTNHIGHPSSFGLVSLLRILDALTNKVRSQGRFAALKLHRQRWRRRTEHQIDGLSERFFAHVVFLAATLFARSLTIDAVLVAAKRQHKNVQCCEVVEKGFARREPNHHRIEQSRQRPLADEERGGKVLV